MEVEQFVMAYQVEQDRIRALLPTGFTSLRPVLRINGEIRDTELYLEFNTPVAAFGKNGWLNIARWATPETTISCQKQGAATTFTTDFLSLTFVGVGIVGGCPAERDNDGCFYGFTAASLVPPEIIRSNKEFCDGQFAWSFAPGDAHGASFGGKTLPALAGPVQKQYPRQALTPQAAAQIACRQMLGQYRVRFQR